MSKRNPEQLFDLRDDDRDLAGTGFLSSITSGDSSRQLIDDLDVLRFVEEEDDEPGIDELFI
jgi:hypothetical protein